MVSLNLSLQESLKEPRWWWYREVGSRVLKGSVACSTFTLSLCCAERAVDQGAGQALRQDQQSWEQGRRQQNTEEPLLGG